MAVKTELSIEYNSRAVCKFGHDEEWRHKNSCYYRYNSTCFICDSNISEVSFEIYRVDSSTNLKLIYHPSCFKEAGCKEISLLDDPLRKAESLVIHSDHPLPKCVECKNPTLLRCLTTVIRGGKEIHLCNHHLGNGYICFVCKEKRNNDFDGTSGKFVEVLIIENKDGDKNKGGEKKLYRHAECIPAECYGCSLSIYMDRLKICIGNEKAKPVNWTSKEIHPSCIDRINCSCCGIKGDGKMVVGADHLVRHWNCINNACNICFKVIGPYPYNDLAAYSSDRFLCHASCVKSLTCSICNTGGGDIIYTGIIIRHDNCITDVCKLCSKVIGPDSHKNIGDTSLYHQKCLEMAKCYICGSIGGDLKYGNQGIHHKQLCTSDICPVCADIIGPSPSSKINGENYHMKCVDEIKCYACGENGKGKKIIDSNRTTFENRFIHDNCSSAKCSECELFIGAAPIRVVCGKLYHGGIIAHGPKCDICKEFTANDVASLLPLDDINDRKYSVKKYRHTTCSKDECIVCLKPLGKIDDRVFVTPDGMLYKEPPLSEETIQSDTKEITKEIAKESKTKIRKIEVHLNCMFECLNCQSVYVDYNEIISSIPHDQRNTPIQIVNENLKHLPLYFQQIAISIWLTIRQIASDIDKNLIKYMIKLVISMIPGIERILPIKRATFDFNNICTIARCANGGYKCRCGKDFSWDLQDHMGCQPKRCSLAIKAFQEIKTIAYGKQPYFTWPQSEEEGFNTTTCAILKAKPQDALICHVKYKAVKRLLAGRK